MSYRTSVDSEDEGAREKYSNYFSHLIYTSPSSLRSFVIDS